jgi:hypothetical protein
MKSPTFYNGFGFPTSIFAQRDPVAHKIRKQTLAPLFSKSAVDGLEGIVQENSGQLRDRYAEFARKGKPVPVQNSLFCLTVGNHPIFGHCWMILLTSKGGYHCNILFRKIIPHARYTWFRGRNCRPSPHLHGQGLDHCPLPVDPRIGRTVS